jgi:general secretion pathway protein D
MGGAQQPGGAQQQNGQGSPSISQARMLGGTQSARASYGDLAAVDGPGSAGMRAAGDDTNTPGTLPGVRIADQPNYGIIERALNQLDRPKLQVAIDLTIAEVTRRSVSGWRNLI